MWPRWEWAPCRLFSERHPGRVLFFPVRINGLGQPFHAQNPLPLLHSIEGFGETGQLPGTQLDLSLWIMVVFVLWFYAHHVQNLVLNPTGQVVIWCESHGQN